MFFYLTLFNSKAAQRVTKWCISALALGSAGLILWQFLFCHPLSMMWEWDGLETCGDRVCRLRNLKAWRPILTLVVQKPLYLAVCIWSIFTDLLVLVVPLPIIWKLKMERMRKIRLSWLFAAGLVYVDVSSQLLWPPTINVSC
jgi:hypothetical protein